MRRESGRGTRPWGTDRGRGAIVIPAIRQLSAMLERRTKMVLVALATESLVASTLEAGVLVIIAGAGLAVASGSGQLTAPLPFVDGTSIDIDASIALAALASVLLLALHLHAAGLAATLSSKVLRTTRNRAIDAYAGASWAKQAGEREGSLQETVSTLAAQTSSLAFAVSQLISALMAVIALSLAAVLIDPWVTLAAVVAGTSMLFVLRPMLARTKRHSRSYVAANSQFTETIAEWTAVALELNVFGAAQTRATQLKQQSHSVSVALRRAQLSSKVGSLLYRDLAIVLLVLAIGALHRWSGADLAGTGAALLLVLRTLTYGQQVNQSLQHLTELQPNLEALAARTDALVASAKESGTREVAPSAVLELTNVTFSYDGREAVRAASFTWRRGEMVGIIGASGSGKSTIVQLLCRLRPPDGGEILLDGVPHHEYSNASWTKHVALVPQEPRLIAGTILDNVTFYRPWISRDDATEAVANAQLLNEILALPSGLDTPLGPRGLGLSGGQRQRLCIARALASRPSFLLLDEPTSALDPNSEERVQQTLRSLHTHRDVGVLIVAHRLSTLSDCDRVLAMSDGRIVADGPLSAATAAIGTQWARDAEPEH